MILEPTSALTFQLGSSVATVALTTPNTARMNANICMVEDGILGPFPLRPSLSPCSGPRCAAFPISPAQDLTADNSSALAPQGCDKNGMRIELSEQAWRSDRWGTGLMTERKNRNFFPPYPYLGRLCFSTPWTSQRFGGEATWSGWKANCFLTSPLQKHPLAWAMLLRMHKNDT